MCLVSFKLESKNDEEEDFGLLVQVDYDITAFTSPAYQRSRLLRSYKEVLS